MLKTIKKGDNSDIVKVAQYLLGHSAMNKASGVYDDAFFDAVKQWQESNGLDVDGVIGSKTWKKIAKQAPICSTSKNKKSGYTCAIQILVGGIDVDGIYGTKTKKAVSVFQEASGLGVDGICGANTWTALITGKNDKKEEDGTDGDYTNGKHINHCVHYLQWDSRWKKIKYSTHTASQTIGNSGCGPSAMAQIMATWVDPKITPVEMCELALKGGYRTYDSGTSGGFFKYVFKQYDAFEKFLNTSSMPTIKAALGEGALAVCCMNSNDNRFWTSGGHYITAIGYDDDGYIYANDPNKKEHPRKQKEDKFKKCLKGAWIFWPKNKPSDNIPEEITEPEKPIVQDVDKQYSGGKIVDISKHQGTIDFDEFSKQVCLVIARASCGSDKDIKIDEYAKAMNAREIPFGVYCYSYAGATAKAKEEAKNMVKYAKEYKPLFYVLDAEEDKITNEAIVAFANELRNQGIKKIGCYVAHHKYKDYKFDSAIDLFDFIWIPRYGNNDGTIENSIKPAYKCDLWQFTSKGKVDGISGDADMNAITGDGHDLSWFVS